MTEIHFTVPGPPKGKARARTVHTGGRTFSYTPEGTVLYENLVKTCFYQTGAHPFDADEELKANIRRYAEERKEKYLFMFAFRSKIPLYEHLMRYFKLQQTFKKMKNPPADTDDIDEN